MKKFKEWNFTSAKGYKIDGKSWHSAGHKDNCRTVIPDSDQNFTKGNSLEPMLQETFDWFERF